MVHFRARHWVMKWETKNLLITFPSVRQSRNCLWGKEEDE